jgi:multidrug efflux pump subunit AcrA (membrane-fusion protein)
MATKPVNLPEFALLDQIDATSLQNNVVAPTQAIKDYGMPRKSRLPRQYLNYLGRMLSEWTGWASNQSDETVASVAAEAVLREAADTYIINDLNAEIDNREDADAAEALARATADSNEATARGNADAAELLARQTADTTEAGTRATADINLGNRITAIENNTNIFTEVLSLSGFGAGEDVDTSATVLITTHDTGAVVIEEVTLIFPTDVFGENAADASIYLFFTDASISAAIRPAFNQKIAVSLLNGAGSAADIGFISLTTTGTWNFQLNGVATFTDTIGDYKGLWASQIRYIKSIT